MSEPQQPPHDKPEPPAGQAPTTPMTTPAPGPAAAPASNTSAEQPATGQPATGQPTTGEPAAAAQPAPGVPHPAHYPPPPGRTAVVGRVVRHRATQLVAVGLLGVVLGAGIVALADRDRPRYGVGSDRPGHSRFDERGPHRGGPDRVDPDRGRPDRVPGRDFER